MPDRAEIPVSVRVVPDPPGANTGFAVVRFGGWVDAVQVEDIAAFDAAAAKRVALECVRQAMLFPLAHDYFAAAKRAALECVQRRIDRSRGEGGPRV